VVVRHGEGDAVVPEDQGEHLTHRDWAGPGLTHRHGLDPGEPLPAVGHEDEEPLGPLVADGRLGHCGDVRGTGEPRPRPRSPEP